MGAWGARIYEDDTALDIRADFRERLEQGHNVEDIEIDVLHDYLIDYAENDDVVHLALCCVELETGTLTKSVKEKALEVIDSGRQKEYWLQEAGKVGAGLRKRELTLIRKYIE